MRKMMFWVGFLLPVVQVALYRQISVSPMGADIVSTVALLLILGSMEFELIALLFIIAALDHIWSLYIPMYLAFGDITTVYLIVNIIAAVASAIVISRALFSWLRTAQG